MISKMAWPTLETFIASVQKKFSTFSFFTICLCLCLLGFAYYITNFPQADFEIATTTEATTNKVIKDLAERRTHLKKTCMNLQVESYGIENSFLYRDKSHNLLFCRVPKCGSTYWLRFLQALNYKNVDPFDKVTFRVHRSDMALIRFDSREALDFNKMIRFIVTRSPYSRLYSAYIDKLFLPEFWYSFGRKIIKRFRKNATSVAELCGHDLTFSEFLKMIAHTGLKQKEWMDQHWQPIVQLCNPCKYEYNYNIREETLPRDRDYLISEVGVTNQFILKYNKISHMDNSLTTINDLCNTIYIHFCKRKPKECYKIENLLQRLFITFQIQGYIEKDALFDLGRFGDLKKPNITRIVKEFQNIYMENPVLTRHEWEEQRNFFRKKAYQLVDTEILKGIQRAYDLDFRIFNYDLEPDEIFANRKKIK